MASARIDTYGNDLQYERINKDSLVNACIAAICASLATVNFGYALGFSAEAELFDVFNEFNGNNTSSSLNPGSNHFDIFASLVAVGALMGCLLGGYLIDKIGRKGTILVTALFYTPGWLLITYSFCYIDYDQFKQPPRFPENYKGLAPYICNTYPYTLRFSMLYIGRILTGVGVGMSSLVVPVYIAEVSSGRMRGALGNINQVSINLGFFLSYVFGYLYGMPVATFVPIGISLLNVFLMVAFLPETPRYLLANNKRHDAILALYWLRGPDFQVEEECFEIEATVNFGNQDTWTMKDLKSSAFYWPLCISIFLMFFQEFSGINCILFYCPSLLRASGIGGRIDPSIPQVEVFDNIADTSMLTALYVCTTLLVFTIVSCFLVDRYGRRKLLLLGSCGMSLSLFVIGVYVREFPTNQKEIVHFMHHNTVFPIAALCLTLIFVAMFSLGWGPLPWLLMTELFPLKTRAVATGIVTFANWSFVFITTVSFNSIITLVDIYGTFWIFASITFLGFFFTFFFVPETKGRPLEDVAEMFIRRKLLQVNIPWTRHDAL